MLSCNIDNYLIKRQSERHIIIEDIIKMCKNKCVRYNKIIWLIMKKTRLKMKNRLHMYDINRPTPRHEHKYTNFKMCHSTMMVICIKQHLNNIWSSIHEKLSNTEAQLKKKTLLIKKACTARRKSQRSIYFFLFLLIFELM